MSRFGVMVLAAGLSMVGIAAARADPAPPAGVPSEDGMTAFALQWFVRLQAGEIDRTQYTAVYSAQLSDSAVRAMSHQLNQYGASPLRAEIMQKRAIDDQTFYQVKLISRVAMLPAFCLASTPRVEYRRQFPEHGGRLTGERPIRGLGGPPSLSRPQAMRALSTAPARRAALQGKSTWTIQRSIPLWAASASRPSRIPAR